MATVPTPLDPAPGDKDSATLKRLSVDSPKGASLSLLLPARSARVLILGLDRPFQL